METTIFINESRMQEQIFVRLLMRNRTVTIDVDIEKDSIEDVKLKVYDQEPIEADKMRLIYNSQQLSDEGKTLANYHIPAGATLQAALNIGGD